MTTKPKMIFLDVKPSFHYPVRRSSGFQAKKNSIALYGTDTRPSLTSISSTGNFKKDIVFSNIGASHYFLRCIGAMPVSWPTPGNAFFSFSSMPFAYSFLIFVLLAAYVGYVAVSRVQIVSSVKGPFEEAVIAYLFLVNILPIFIVPIIWSEAQKIANLMNDWNDFEILYYQITGHIVPLKIKTKAKTITFLLPLLSIMSVVISHTTMAKFNLVEDVVFSNIGVSHYFLRCIGSMPITRSTPGNATFSLGSISFAYSFLFFALLTAYVGYVAISRVHIVSSLKGPFEEAVIAYLFLVNILPIILIPIIWTESSKIANLMNDWNDFEILYYQISGHSVPLQLKKKAVVITMVLPVLSILSVVITHVSMADFHLVQVIPYCILDNLTAMLGAWWYLSCEALSDTANILAERFQKALRHIGPAAMVADYRALWLRLSKLTRDTGTATCYTFTFLNLYLFFIITLSIYGLMSQLSEGFGTKDIGLAITALWSIGLLFFICDEAHYASHNVRTNFQKKLLMVELNWMNSDAQTEINMFLRATEMNPSNINCGGFFDVNRNLFKGLLTTMVTYLVVLLQFQISIPDGKQKGNLTLTDTGFMMNGTDSGMHMTPH